MKVTIHTEIDKDTEFEIKDLSPQERIKAREYFERVKTDVLMDISKSNDPEILNGLINHIVKINEQLDALKNFEAIMEGEK